MHTQMCMEIPRRVVHCSAQGAANRARHKKIPAWQRTLTANTARFRHKRR